MVSLTRASDVFAVLDLLRSIEGDAAVARALQRQEMPLEIEQRPDALILHRDSVGLHEQAARILGMNRLGLAAADQSGLESLGLFGMYVCQAQTMREGFQRGVATLGFNENGSHSDLEIGDVYSKFVYRGVDRSTLGWDKMADFIVGLVMDLAKHFAGSEWKPSWVEVDYPKPNHKPNLENWIEAPVVFDANCISVVFLTSQLKMRNQYEYEPTEIVTSSMLSENIGLLERGEIATIAGIINTRLMYGQSDQEGLASKLGYGVRTLQRILENNNTNYRTLVGHSRKKHALGYLKDSQLTINQIAKLLGYSTSSHFIRAFKEWTGISPKKFRALNEKANQINL